jgi:hypothetical protein
MNTKETTYAQEIIREHIFKKMETGDDIQNYSESYSDYSYQDANSW